MKTWLLSIVPIVVGITALTVLDGQLGQLSPKDFQKLFTNPYLRGATLFGAAYAANGARLWPALTAIYVYFLIVTSNEWKQMTHSFFGKQKIHYETLQKSKQFFDMSDDSDWLHAKPDDEDDTPENVP
jgi:hypothetical protein